MTWRDSFNVHPAADLFPMMDDDDLRRLADDIKVNGLQHPIVFAHGDGYGAAIVLLDGRNRLAALEMLGRKFNSNKGGCVITTLKAHDEYTEIKLPADPYAYVASANLHRRHLTAEQKRDLIAKLLAAQPAKSDRAIAATVKASPTTVSTVRRQLERIGTVSKLDTRTGRDGVVQSAHKVAHVAPSDVWGENVVNLPLGTPAHGVPPEVEKTAPANPFDALKHAIDHHWTKLTYAEQERLIEWLMDHRAELEVSAGPPVVVTEPVVEPPAAEAVHEPVDEPTPHAAAEAPDTAPAPPPVAPDKPTAVAMLERSADPAAVWCYFMRYGFHDDPPPAGIGPEFREWLHNSTEEDRTALRKYHMAQQ